MCVGVSDMYLYDISTHIMYTIDWNTVHIGRNSEAPSTWAPCAKLGALRPFLPQALGGITEYVVDFWGQGDLVRSQRAS